MNRTIINGETAAIVLIAVTLVAGYLALEENVDPAAPASPTLISSTAAAEAHPGFLYGRITAYDGTTYEGPLRWGGDEEAFWGNYFNGFKDKNPWIALVPPEQLIREHPPIEVFGFEISRDKRQIDLGRPFMTRFGDIARIEARGELGLREVLKTGTEFNPDVRVTLKTGTEFDLDRLSAGDFDDGVRVWDDMHGVVDLGPHQIRTIELLPGDGLGDAPDRLYGTVHTRQGNFTGFLQWDREEAVGHDELVGRTPDGELSLRFDSIRSIARHSRNSSLVTLLDGQEIVLSGTRKVGQDNRGIYVDDPRYGRVLVSWDAFEHVEFSSGGSGPSYDDFPPGRPLTGSVTTRDDRHLVGRLVYDLDESEITETLDAPFQGVDYTIPFGLVTSIALSDREQLAAGRARVILQSGEELQLERSGDLGDENAGLLIFVDGRGHPEYVSWSDIKQIDFDRPSAMYPPIGGR